jgi:DNA (cytosine-5)-methyltransferase 1
LKPRLLDLFCGAGGCSVGYARAGFEVVGVDVAAQANYPFRFVQADALEYLDTITFDGVTAYTTLDGLEIFDAIHASPPCQHFTAYGNVVKDIKDRYENLLEPTRELLKAAGLPYVIENVVGAPMEAPVLLCGSMFDLDVRRHRLFETNWDLQPPAWGCRHKIWGPNRFPGGNKVRRERDGRSRSKALIRGTVEVGTWSIPLATQKAAMGVDWEITTRELSEAIPPAYTEFIGAQLLAHIGFSVGVSSGSAYLGACIECDEGHPERCECESPEAGA